MFRKKEVIEVKVQDETRVNELLKEIQELKKDHQKEIESQRKEFELDKKLWEKELTSKIEESLRDKTKEAHNTAIQNGVLKEKVAMYEKAFENLGFDVKDMKEILNKLVDGIVSGNKVNIIK